MTACQRLHERRQQCRRRDERTDGRTTYNNVALGTRSERGVYIRSAERLGSAGSARLGATERLIELRPATTSRDHPPRDKMAPVVSEWGAAWRRRRQQTTRHPQRRRRRRRRRIDFLAPVSGVDPSQPAGCVVHDLTSPPSPLKHLRTTTARAPSSDRDATSSVPPSSCR